MQYTGTGTTHAIQVQYMQYRYNARNTGTTYAIQVQRTQYRYNARNTGKNF